MDPHGPIVGVLIRVDPERSAAAAEALDVLSGVSTFELDVPASPASIGALLEAKDLDEAHARLRNEVLTVPGVRAAWPVDIRLPDDPAESTEAPHADPTS